MATSITKITPGVCYGKVNDRTGFPAPSVFFDLCKKHHIKRIRLYRPEEDLLGELNKRRDEIKDVEVILGIPNNEVGKLYLADGLDAARQWVKHNVTAYRNVNFKCITVGDQLDPKTDIIDGHHLFLALKNVKKIIVELELWDKIKVSTVVDAESALKFEHCPTGCSLEKGYANLLGNVLQKLVKWKAPLLVNVHPFRFYLANKCPPLPADDNVTQNLDYALFRSTHPVVFDGNDCNYTNNFDAILDAVYLAVQKFDTSCAIDKVNIIVSESGWPTSGHPVATVANADVYNNSLIDRVKGNRGTPRKPRRPIETYILGLFDERVSGSPGQNFEENWGIFRVPVVGANAAPKYFIDFDPRPN